MRRFAVIGAALGFLAVAFGAFGAHALRDRITPDLLTVFQTGVQYQAMHALALLAVGLVGPEGKFARAACQLFVLGVIVFSGSLYLLAITGTKLWGAVTPIGGICFLAGWAVLVWSLRQPTTA